MSNTCMTIYWGYSSGGGELPGVAQAFRDA